MHFYLSYWCVYCDAFFLYRDLTLELPFTLTNPKPAKPVISQMVTLPYKSPAGKTSEGGDGGGGEGGEKKGEGEEGKTAADGAEEAKVNGEMENGEHVIHTGR